MNNTNLLEQKIERISYTNDVYLPDQKEGSINIEIGTKISSQVNYNEDEKRCKCIITLELSPQNLDVNYSVELSMCGIFEYDINVDQKEIHLEVYHKLFPFLQASATSFLTLTGIPNFFLQEPGLNIEDVNS